MSAMGRKRTFGEDVRIGMREATYAAALATPLLVVEPHSAARSGAQLIVCEH